MTFGDQYSYLVVVSSMYDRELLYLTIEVLLVEKMDIFPELSLSFNEI